MELSLNMFDMIVLTVIGLSALLSFYRGFLREIFSLAGWVVAAVVTLRFLEPASAMVKPHVGSDVVASGIASVGLFFITLIGISVASGLILKVLKPAAKIGLFDNLAGLAFGVARGVLIIALGYFIMTIVLAEKNYPEWIKASLSKPYVEQVVVVLKDLTPEYLDKLTKPGKEGEGLGEGLEKGLETLKEKTDVLREKTAGEAENAADDLDAALKEEAERLPTMEDLQQRMRDENEGR
jgi:membrane protein required for colicin V production